MPSSKSSDKVMMHTTVPEGMRDRARALSALVTDSHSLVELFTKGLYDFLNTRPYLKKTFVWQGTKSTFVKLPTGGRAPSGYIAINLQIGHVDLADGTRIDPPQLASALVAVASEHCQKSGKKSEGMPNLHRAVTTVLHHIVTTQFPPDKYPTAVPKKKAALPSNVPQEILDAPPVVRKTFKAGVARSGYWMGAVLNPKERKMFKKLGGGDWLKAMLAKEMAEGNKQKGIKND